MGRSGSASSPSSVARQIIRSKAFPRAPTIEAVDVTLDWRDLESPATLTGSLLVRKTAVDIAAWIAQPSSLMRNDHSAVAFHIHSAPIDLSANGDLVSAATTGFSGHVSAKAQSTAALMDLIGIENIPAGALRQYRAR